MTIFYFIYYDLLINKKRLFIFVTSFFLLISALSLNENLKHRYFWQYYVNLSDPKESQAGIIVLQCPQSFQWNNTHTGAGFASNVCVTIGTTKYNTAAIANTIKITF